ncbi:MAG: hypothetical protein IKJ11_07500 [Clostridia bacterium]|nr:hypothetical protein [Clostridia bacterium]
MEHNLIFEGLEQNMDTPIPDFAGEGLEEFAPSMEVQAAEIREVFMDIPELQFENWKNLDVSERVDALQQLENEVAEIAHRPALGIELETLEPGVLGYCNGDKIVISDSLLGIDGMYREVLDTVFHEGRHAYQFHNLYGEQVEKNEVLVESWRDNFEKLGYESGDWAIFKDIGFLRYKNQPVEVDARAFANVVLSELNI